MSPRQTAETFWSRVAVRGPNDCWDWVGSHNSTGYGVVAWDGEYYTAHRVAAWLHGLVSSPRAPHSKRSKKHVLHKCDRRPCCNPEHFFLGNYTDNQKDAYAKGRKVQPKGANHVNAKLTVATVRHIRRRYTNGEKQVSLAKEYGVSQRAISRVVRGETYK